MDKTDLQLTPEQRQALLAHPDSPVYIADQQTQKIYLLVEQGKIPELEEEYIRDGLEMARAQIASGIISTTSIQEVIAAAERHGTASI